MCQVGGWRGSDADGSQQQQGSVYLFTAKAWSRDGEPAPSHPPPQGSRPGLVGSAGSALLGLLRVRLSPGPSRRWGGERSASPGSSGSGGGGSAGPHGAGGRPPGSLSLTGEGRTEPGQPQASPWVPGSPVVSVSGVTAPAPGCPCSPESGSGGLQGTPAWCCGGGGSLAPGQGSRVIEGQGRPGSAQDTSPCPGRGGNGLTGISWGPAAG